MEIIKTFLIKEPAQEFIQPPKVEIKGKDAVLIFDYETETGDYQLTGITFINTIDYRHVNEDAVNENMMKAYNAVVELKNSDWLQEMRKKMNDDSDMYKHFLVYFDGFGAYEFICTDVVKGI